MKQQFIPAQTYIVKAICEKCGGELLLDSTAPVLTSNPPKFMHKCSKCGEIEYLDRTYPTTAVQVEGDEDEES